MITNLIYKKVLVSTLIVITSWNIINGMGDDSTITLRASDNHEYTLAKKIACASKTIQFMLEDVSGNEILFSEIDGPTLETFARLAHAGNSLGISEKNIPLEKDVIEGMSQLMPEFNNGNKESAFKLLSVLNAANYLDDAVLMHVAGYTIAKNLHKIFMLFESSKMNFVQWMHCKFFRDPKLHCLNDYIRENSLKALIAKYYYLQGLSVAPHGHLLDCWGCKDYHYTIQELRAHKRLYYERTLHALHVEYNYLGDIHYLNTLAPLQNLTDLYLGGNKISEFPDSIARALTRLQKLVLAGNQFTHFPQSITHLTSLSALHVSNNPITDIPNDSFDSLKQLKFLDLIATPLARDEEKRKAIQERLQDQKVEIKFDFVYIPHALNRNEIIW